jgi:hypothetical protein
VLRFSTPDFTRLHVGIRLSCAIFAGLFAFVTTTSLASGQGSKPTSEVIVMGMIHSGHRTNSDYDIETIKRIVRRVKPDYILCEIPPDRFDEAMKQFRDSGKVTENRVKRFPEYVDAIFPLTREMKFTIVPCAAWTKAMADDRRGKLERYKTERPDDVAEMDRAEKKAEKQMKAEHLSDTPKGIHSDRYDELVEQALEPYSRLFNDDLGLGGWENINAAHCALIEKALDKHAAEGARFLVTFGAWHKYWIKRRLAKRPDVRLRPLADFLDQPK